MDKEEFEKLKQKEKEHLSKIRELKRQLRSARGTLRAKKALTDIEQASDMSELNAALEAVTGSTIDAEARLDVAMQMASESDTDPALSPEELRRQKADALVEQMKSTLLSDPDLTEKEIAPGKSSGEEEDALPEKTIGRMKPESSSEEKPLPEKTIGRMGSAGKDDA